MPRRNTRRFPLSFSIVIEMRSERLGGARTSLVACKKIQGPSLKKTARYRPSAPTPSPRQSCAKLHATEQVTLLWMRHTSGSPCQMAARASCSGWGRSRAAPWLRQTPNTCATASGPARKWNARVKRQPRVLVPEQPRAEAIPSGSGASVDLQGAQGLRDRRSPPRSASRETDGEGAQWFLVWVACSYDCL